MEVQKCDVSLLVPGDVLSRVSYMHVVSKTDTTITVKNEAGLQWTIGKDIVESECVSADHFINHVKVSATELARIMHEDVRNTCFTAMFAKKLTVERIKELLSEEAVTELNVGTPPTKKRKRHDIASQIMSGEKRVLRGYAQKSDAFMGRASVIDMDVVGPHKQRQVDFRTLDHIIVNGTKYSLR